MMNIQDKIGREEAKLFLEKLAPVHEWIPVRVEIFMNTTSYKFFANKEKLIRDRNSAKVLFPLELNRLLEAKIITNSDRETYQAMLDSEHEGDFTVLEHVLNTLRNQRLRSKRKVKSE